MVTPYSGMLVVCDLYDWLLQFPLDLQFPMLINSVYACCFLLRLDVLVVCSVLGLSFVCYDQFSWFPEKVVNLIVINIVLAGLWGILGGKGKNLAGPVWPGKVPESGLY